MKDTYVCLDGCGDTVLFMGWRGDDHRFMCQSCFRIYESKDELKGKSEEEVVVKVKELPDDEEREEE